MAKRRSTSLKEKKIYEPVEFKPLPPYPAERKDKAKTTEWLDYLRYEENQGSEENLDESIISKA